MKKSICLLLIPIVLNNCARHILPGRLRCCVLQFGLCSYFTSSLAGLRNTNVPHCGFRKQQLKNYPNSSRLNSCQISGHSSLSFFRPFSLTNVYIARPLNSKQSKYLTKSPIIRSENSIATQLSTLE